MHRGIAARKHLTHRTLRAACAAAFAVAVAASLAPPARAERVTPPPVPANLEADAGSRAFLVGHAVGTQNYVCQPAGLGFAWTLFTPVATLFSDNGRQLTTHFFSPNPIESGTVRPAWQHSRDTSTVWVRLVDQSADPAYVAPGAIPWLLLEVVGKQDGPHGGGALAKTAQIQRLNTVGGAAPSTGCAEPTDVGKRVYVPYLADYYFYSTPE
ncbi:MAG: hypothetical protein DCC71_00840 [Proteobacteria bacterium]|nr:MAG: hypothetical protein DCC71_00840 [Pseudomonadota bacterium]